MLSPVLFCLYLEGLLSLLAKSGVERLVGECYIGALAYTDDIVLLAPYGQCYASHVENM